MNRKRLWNSLYMQNCRNYSRLLGDKPADIIYRVMCSIEFWKEHRYLPRMKNPRSFSEKVWHRMLFDRNPIWTIISDKLLVRDYVAERVGNEYLIPLLWHGKRPEDIPFDKLPMEFVVKANHGCGYNIIVMDKSKLDLGQVRLQLGQWIGENFCQAKLLGMAWAYKNIRPSIMVESFIDDSGQIPMDYKFFCYSGKVEFIQLNFDRFGDAFEKFVDREFSPLDLWNGIKQYPRKVVPPYGFSDMIRVAESLSQGFNFLRVDLYNVGRRIYFGELTCYPAAGLARFKPREYDFVFGEKWPNS